MIAALSDVATMETVSVGVATVRLAESGAFAFVALGEEVCAEAEIIAAIAIKAKIFLFIMVVCIILSVDE